MRPQVRLLPDGAGIRQTDCLQEGCNSMSGIGLEIVLDIPGKTYTSGEKIGGQVNTVVAKEFQSAALILVLLLEGSAEGKNFTYQIEWEKEKKTLFEGPWAPGRYSYPFELSVPDQPVPYKGHIFSLSWHIGSKARSSTGESAKAEVGIAVIPQKRISGNERERSGEIVYKESARSLKGFFLVSLIIFLAGGMVAWRTSPFVKETVTDGFIYGGVIPMLLGLGLFFIGTWQALVNKRIKTVEVKVNCRHARVGERIPCSVTFEANVPFQVDRVSVTLIGEELVNFGGGSSRKFHKHLLYEKKHELSLPVKKVPGNGSIQAQGEFSVPSDAHYSFSVNDSDKPNDSDEGLSVRWRIVFLIEMKNWPDWMHLETINVVP